MNNFSCFCFLKGKDYSSILEEWKSRGQKLVFTNGCFDLLHAGHVQYLNEARRLGDKLVVGLNSDASVRRLKGNSRPITKLEDRASVLSALRAIDLILSFDEDTPLQLIKNLKPDIIVKGGDYNIDEMIGKEFVEAYGGKVKVLDFKNGYSTSLIIDKFST